MKKQIVVALALLLGSFTYAQKDEIKAAEKAIKSGNYADAKSAINSAEALIANADDKTKAKFYFIKGQALYANGNSSDADMDAAIESFDMVKTIEEQSGRSKYSGDVDEIKQSMLSKFLSAANSALEKKDYISSSKGFEKAYKMSPKDTLYLYYAASTAVTANDYETSLKYYEELRDLGYSGVETRYVAVNKETNEEETFDTATLRDISVRAGSHIKPGVKKTESKSAEIIKNIALIYVNNGDNEKAATAIKDARKENPDDLSLLLTAANVQLKMGNKEEFKTLIEEATLKDPDNAELQYNLGVIAADAGDIDAAKKYYSKALALNPGYVDANNNMAVAILGEEQSIIEEMNSLGSSAADNKRYDELKEARLSIYKEAVPYLEATLKLKPKNIDAAKTLMQIYSAIDNTVKFKEMKALVEKLESGN
jgi:tetratricopeptide (TPR) repeat protein